MLRLVMAGFIALALSHPALADARSPMGIDCLVTDQQTGQQVEFNKLSPGPWAIMVRDVERDGVTYQFRMEASSRYQRGVLHIENQATQSDALWYDQVRTQTPFQLSHEGWRVVCRHFPYIAG